MRPPLDQLLENPADLPPTWAHDTSNLSRDHRRALLREARPVHFTTSGSSGPPVAWERIGEQLLAEAEATAAALPNDLEAVITIVAPTSVYGHALGVELGILLGLPTRRVSMRAAPVGPGDHVLVVTTPIVWRRAGFLPITRPGQRTTFVHAGAVLPPVARARVDELSDAVLVEFYGATECGLIGFRRHGAGVDRATPWTAAADVRIQAGPLSSTAVAGDEAPIVVTSPRVGRPVGGPVRDTVQLSDWIEALPRGTFRFEGRRDRICKPNGVAVDLDDLEDVLWSLASDHLDLACLPAVQHDQGEVIEVHVTGPDEEIEAFRQLVRHHRVPGSPRVVPVAAIDRSPMGKVRSPRTAA